MSEIKVNKISPRTNCGTVTLGDSGDTITIPSVTVPQFVLGLILFTFISLIIYLLKFIPY